MNASRSTVARHDARRDLRVRLLDTISLHQQGHLAEAILGYHEVLRLEPRQFDALRLLGAAQLAAGQAEAAYASLGKALSVRTDLAEVWKLRGNAAMRLRRFDDAAETYGRAAALQPDDAGAWSGHALALGETGRYEEALASLARALALRPDSVELWRNRAVALGKLKRTLEALDCCARVLQAEAADFSTWMLSGSLLGEQSRYDEAVHSLDRALELQPDAVEALVQRGFARVLTQRFKEAEPDLLRAYELAPERQDVVNGLARTMLGLKRHAEALQYVDRLLAAPDPPVEAWTYRGLALMGLSRQEEAREAFSLALQLRPRQWLAQLGVCSLERIAGRLDDAAAALARAFAAREDTLPFWALYGAELAVCARPYDALPCLERATEFAHCDPTTRFNLGLLHLTLERFDSGWDGYEWRLKVPDMMTPPLPKIPVWDGREPLSGRTLLLTCEQGLGDAIQFGRYAAWLAQHRSARVAMVVPPSLRSVMRTLPRPVQVLSDGDPMPAFDFQCPLLSIPHRLRTRLDGIVADVPYLQANPARVSLWQGQLGPARRRRIGLVCSGNPKHSNDLNRSIALSRLARLCGLDAELHLLQKDLRDEDAPALRELGIADHRHELKDFADTAALIACLDLVISVDTSVAHLAGALGAPLWLLLPANPDWRWMLERDNSPWYPTARLFRQRRLGDWDDLMVRVADELALCAIAAKRSQQPR